MRGVAGKDPALSGGFLTEGSKASKGGGGGRQPLLCDLRDLLLKLFEYLEQKLTKSAKEEPFANFASFC